jgi:hypothetical protein
VALCRMMLEVYVGFWFWDLFQKQGCWKVDPSFSAHGSLVGSEIRMADPERSLFTSRHGHYKLHCNRNPYSLSISMKLVHLTSISLFLTLIHKVIPVSLLLLDSNGTYSVIVMGKALFALYISNIM